MFVRINNSFINLSVVTGVYQTNDPDKCNIFYINNKNITVDIGLDEFIKEVDKQAKNALNIVEAKESATMEDRFRLMDIEVS